MADEIDRFLGAENVEQTIARQQDELVFCRDRLQTDFWIANYNSAAIIYQIQK